MQRDLNKNGGSTIFKGLFVRRSLNRKTESWPDHTRGNKTKHFINWFAYARVFMFPQQSSRDFFLLKVYIKITYHILSFSLYLMLFIVLVLVCVFLFFLLSSLKKQHHFWFKCLYKLLFIHFFKQIKIFLLSFNLLFTFSITGRR